MVLRLAHSAIHLTTNRVIHRLIAFALSNFVLLFPWIGFLRSLLRARVDPLRQGGHSALFLRV